VLARFNFGRNYLALGDFARAIDYLDPNCLPLQDDRPWAGFASPGLGLPASVFRSWRILDLAECGEFRAAITLGEEALQIAVHADPPEVEQADRYYGQALALAEELGMRPLVAHCHLGFGTLYQRAGRLGEAQAELSAAAELYRMMEMTFWLEKAEAALAQV